MNNINIICDYCEWAGNLKDFDEHLALSPTCDYRDECCKTEEVKQLSHVEDVCDECDRRINDYWEDFNLEQLMGQYYEGN